MSKAEGKGKQREQRRRKWATSSFNLPTALASYHIDSVSHIYAVATLYMEALFDRKRLMETAGISRKQLHLESKAQWSPTSYELVRDFR
jgi:hypothetical protein